jgi:hypothetical protein
MLLKLWVIALTRLFIVSLNYLLNNIPLDEILDKINQLKHEKRH